VRPRRLLLLRLLLCLLLRLLRLLEDGFSLSSFAFAAIFASFFASFFAFFLSLLPASSPAAGDPRFLPSDAACSRTNEVEARWPNMRWPNMCSMSLVTKSASPTRSRPSYLPWISFVIYVGIECVGTQRTCAAKSRENGSPRSTEARFATAAATKLFETVESNLDFLIQAL
jgi:hypothetical protein